jgi:hypothetical protein
MAEKDNGAVIIDGLAVHIDKERMSDWRTFRILREAERQENQYALVDAMFKVIEHATDQTEESIVAHLGGDDAQATDVIALCTKIIEAAAPKN